MLPLFRTKRIAVAAGKGGVGKSTVAVQLALALQREGQRVGLLDGDLYGPSVRALLKEEKLPFEDEKGIHPGCARGIEVMTLAFFNQPSFVVRAPIANRVLRQLLEVQWGNLDYFIIDFPPGTGDIPITLAEAVEGAILVTTPQEVALLDVVKCARFFERLSVPILGVVENMSGSVFGRGAGRRFAKAEGYPFLGEIPLDPQISAFQDRGQADLVSKTLFQEIANGVQIKASI